MERSENYARLLEAGLRIAMTRSSAASEEWASVLTTAGGRSAYRRKYDEFRQSQIIDWMLRDRENPSSVLSVVKMARDNARLVRTALTREVWESVNECWMTLKDALAAPVADRDLPDMIDLIRRQSALVRGAMLGTLLRNDGFHFARLGTFIERADSTARIVDVK
ncbi:MAG: alpha-E domain-containing protein, partial [Novosphingopyxis baekryungensis]|nr:alpha-E domain-containing protein [Novosphingopyxis baekryungensis]